MPPPIAESYLSLLQVWIAQHLPNPILSARSGLTCGLFISAGMMLVFNSVRLARSVVGLAGCAAGAMGGAMVGDTVGVSPLLCSAVGALAVGWLAWSTDRFWLIVATTIIVLSSGVVAQSDVQILAQLTAAPVAEAGKQVVEAAVSVEPAAGLEQLVRSWLSGAWQRAVTLVQAQNTRGLIIPAIAAVLAILVALRAARMLAGIWLSLAGAAMAVAAALVLVGTVWPQVRAEATAQPAIPAALVGVLWLSGVVAQVVGYLRAKRAAAARAAAAAPAA